MRDSVPIPRYSPICNVLHQWKTLLIPTYRVYRLYDMHECTYVCVNLDSQGKQGNKAESPLSYFHRKKAAQVGLEPMTSCFQGSCSTN